MKKITAVLLVLLLITAFVGCKENTIIPNESSNHETLSQPELSQPELSQTQPPESSEALTLEEKFEGYIIEEISVDRYTVIPKGYSEYDRMHYITDGKGNIISSFECASINKFIYNKFYYVQNSDQSAYFINTNGNRIDDIVYDRLFYWTWDQPPWIDPPVPYKLATIGQIGDEYYLIDFDAKITGKVDTSPKLYEEYDGMRIAKAFNYDDYYYGVIKDGEYIIEPRFWDKPIIKNGGIVANNNAVDTLSSEGYIYDYSGKLVKKVNGYFSAHNDFHFIIERRLKDLNSEEAVFSILSYSGETLYTAEEGVTIDFAKSDTWPPIMPFSVTLNGETVHLEKLIDGIEYPPVTISESVDAKGITPEKLSVIQTPYLCGNGGRQYEVTDELKETVMANLVKYLEMTNIDLDEEAFGYSYDEGDFCAWYAIPASFHSVNSYPGYIARSVADTGDNYRLPDPLSDPIVQSFCKITFSTLENLEVVRTEEGYIIFEEKDSVTEAAYSIARKRVEIIIEEEIFCFIRGTNIGDEQVYPAYTLDAISYDEAVEEFRKGNFKTPPYSLIEFDYEKANIEATKLEYILITDCDCEQCYDVGYYIPCYSFYVRDSDAPEYVGNLLVPAIPIDELNEYLASVSQPTVNHFWTEE